jgi:hypothetical protein
VKCKVYITLNGRVIETEEWEEVDDDDDCGPF